MGTTWSVQAWAPGQIHGHALQAAIHAQLQRAIDLFSHWHSHSEVAQFNAAAAGDFGFSADAWAVVADSLALAAQTQGAVDPTLGALVNLWGFGPPGPRQPPLHAVPSQHDIDTALRCSGFARVGMNAPTRSLHKPADMRLDLGGIAKGWAVDQVSAALLHAGAEVHLVEIGGELKARGLKPDWQPWWVELEPADEQASQMAPPRDLLALVDMAVATSGDWRRQFSHGGQRLSHTLDARTGRPIANGIASVTVLHAQAMQADALATALSVMGAEKAMAWASHHKLAARLTVRGAQGLTEHLSPAMAAMLCEQAP